MSTGCRRVLAAFNAEHTYSFLNKHKLHLQHLFTQSFTTDFSADFQNTILKRKLFLSNTL